MDDYFRTAPDWESVRFFVGLARHRTLSATARALGVNHATVSRRVADLETTLGAALFDRRPTGYELTAVGRSALEAASAMEAAASALSRLRNNEQLKGLLRIAATPSIVEGFLLPRLSTFRLACPAIDIELVGDIRNVSLSRIEADIALRLGRPQKGELLIKRLAIIRFAFYAAANWRDCVADGGEPSFIAFDEANASLPEARWLAAAFPTARIALRTNSQFSQMIAARADLGIALLPCFLANGDKSLARIPLEPTPPERELWMLTRTSSRGNPAVEIAKNFLLDLFQREQHLFDDDARIASSGVGRSGPA